MPEKGTLTKAPFWTMKTAKARNDAGEDIIVGEIQIYGYITEDSWWEDDITPKSFLEELKALGDIKTLHVHINSYGGDVSAGSAVYSILKQHQANVVVHIDGFALSAASVVAMAGDTVIMPGNSMMMIHNPMIRIRGDAGDLRKEADVLDKIRDSMIAAYNDKTGLPRDELIQMLDDETWFTADEAIEKGFADVAAAPLMAAASVRPGVLAMGGVEFDLTGYRNLPESLKKEMEEKNLKDDETGTPPVQNIPITSAEPQTGGAGTRDEISSAVKAERERIKALDELNIPGAEVIIARAKYETGVSPEQAAVEIIKAHKIAGIAAFKDRLADADASGVNNLAAVNNGTGFEKSADIDKKAKALKEAIEKGRDVK
ncbi:MAG: Clp protease ClpP [Synergistaceae bacterium]|jgi:ATP-dependent protease ClpP protease subunit|nr:Clp protease ClpP [Synergistaceae bacterium]